MNEQNLRILIGHWSFVACHYTRFEARWQTTLTLLRFAGIVGRSWIGDKSGRREHGLLSFACCRIWEDTVNMTGAIIRAFDGSLADAEGMLLVERATFDEAPYSPEEVRTMLTAGSQRAWVAVGANSVVGFIVAFATYGLRGPCWEIDLLAVQPDWTRQGLATRLIRAASAHGATVARRARAVVATDNAASERAFQRAGYRTAGTCNLMIYRTEGSSLPHRTTPGVTVREIAGITEITDWLPEEIISGWSPAGQQQEQPRTLTLLLAERNGEAEGYVELIEVQTLLYRGTWIESLAASTQKARTALVHATLARCSVAGQNEIGTMVASGDLPLQQVLLDTQFQSLGSFHWLSAKLPLPGLAAASPSPWGRAKKGSNDGA